VEYVSIKQTCRPTLKIVAYHMHLSHAGRWSFVYEKPTLSFSFLNFCADLIYTLS